MEALIGRFWATFWPENPAERQSIAAEARRIGEALADEELLADALFISYISSSERGDIAEARREIELLGRVNETLRQPAENWLVKNNREGLALLTGDYSEAEALIGLRIESGNLVTPGRDDVAASRTNRFLFRREQGRLAEEEATIRASIQEFPWYPLYRAALACLLSDLGRADEARLVFDDLAADRFSSLYGDNEWLLGMGLASDACAMLGDADAAAVLYEQLAPFAGRNTVGHAEGSVGATDRYLGLLAATRGELDVAVEHLEAAIAANDAMGARPWTAHSQHDLAVVLRRRDAGGDQGKADALDAKARSTAVLLGMILADKIGEPGATRAEPFAETATSMPAMFRREGEYWTVGFGGDTLRVRDSKGMRHLARLLAVPGRELHALELASTDSGTHRAVARGELKPIDGLGDAGEILDPEAKAAYRARLAEIREELDEAERWNDTERVRRLEDERRALGQELAAAVGLGRSRSRGSVSRGARPGQRDARDPGGVGADPGTRRLPRGSSRRHDPDRHVLLVHPRPARADRLEGLSRLCMASSPQSLDHRRERLYADKGVGSKLDLQVVDPSSPNRRSSVAIDAGSPRISRSSGGASEGTVRTRTSIDFVIGVVRPTSRHARSSASSCAGTSSIERRPPFQWSASSAVSRSIRGPFAPTITGRPLGLGPRGSSRADRVRTVFPSSVDRPVRSMSTDHPQAFLEPPKPSSNAMP